MNAKQLVNLFEYTQWANRRVWDCAMTLSDDDWFKPLPYSVGSIFAQLLHIMGVEYWWLGFLRTGELRFIEDDSPYRDRAFFRQQWDELNATNLAYLHTLKAHDLTREVRPLWEYDEPAVEAWQAIMQVINHSTDHRAQILAMLFQMGAPTTEQDYLNYLHEQKK